MRVTLATIYLLVMAAATFAQSDRGIITGAAADPNGAIVRGATVVAKNAATGAEYKTVTTETGNYTLPSLPAGTYDLSVEAPGFKKYMRQGVIVQVVQTARVDIVMQVGETSESVTVTAESSLLKTENAEQSTNISGNLFNSLPFNFGQTFGGSVRNWLSFIQLSPGVSGSDHTASINGAPGGSFKIYLEGQDVTSTNDTVWTSTVAAAGVETIGEFSIQTNNFNAEFGQVLGGVFNFTTKSGTNQLHGSAYDYMTNEALNAHRPFSTPFASSPRAAKALDRKHDYGFTVGGPVYLPKLYDGRNKTFFFFNLERYRNVNRSSGDLTTLPTDAFRRGNFSAILGPQIGTDALGRPILANAIYDPRTTRVVTGTDGLQHTIRDPFPNNVIPESLLDPVALKIQSLIPAPDNGNVVQNWDPRTDNGRFQSIPSLKIDHSFNDRTKLSGYWSVQNTTQVTAADGLPLPITGRRDQKIYGKTLRVNLDQTITPRFVLHLGAGYLRFHNPDSAPEDVLNYDAVANLGFNGSATEPSGFPRIVGPDLGTLLGPNNSGGMLDMGPQQANKFWNDKLTGVANATWVRNNHTYKFGGEFKQEVWSDVNLTAAQGRLSFAEAQTAIPDQQFATFPGGSIGHRYASFLLGQVNTATVSAVKDPQWRKKAFSFYGQDNWKVSPKLTLNYGLRWDYGGQGHEIHYRTSEVSLTTPNPSAGGLPGAMIYEGYGPGRCNCAFTKTYPYAFGPRFGAAYQVDSKTVVRAGWGVTYSQLGNWWYVTGGSSTLGLGFNSINFSNPAYGQSAFSLRDGLNYNRADLYTASLDPGILPTPGQLGDFSNAWWGAIQDRNGGRPGRVNQWNISVQRELFKNLVVEAAYVGNRGVWLESDELLNLNAINPATLQARGIDLNNPADQALLLSQIGSPTAAARGFTAPYAGFPTFSTVAQSLRPYPQFNDRLGVRWAPLGKNWYDSLQVKVTKRYSRGLDLTASYTYQREDVLGRGGNPDLRGPDVNNVFNRDAQRALAATSQPHVFVTAFTYNTPRFGNNRIVRQALGNWVVGGMVRYASGALIPIPYSNNNLYNMIFQYTRQNRVPGQPLFLKDPSCGCLDPRQDLVLNPAAWTDAPAGQFSTTSGFLNDYRWQRQVTENLSLGRRFAIKEKMSFEIRAEFFNIFNRKILPMPESFNPTAGVNRNEAGELSSGFGYVNANNVVGQRNGQLVARFQF
ncbi:MAG TPA: TonB-dependent receptor [Blastocatellia bacterium]|nr:TonB-dependent receptor [Blastocatellia bacterium]